MLSSDDQAVWSPLVPPLLSSHLYSFPLAFFCGLVSLATWDPYSSMVKVMPSNEQLLRLGIFIATGYLCAGIVVAIFAGIPLWVSFFNSEISIASLIVSATFIAGLIIGMLILRPLIPKVGVKAVFEQDVLILMIGLLFMSLAMNQAMLIVGLLVTGAAMSWYFTANFKVQVSAAKKGGAAVFTLGGWALGPIVAVAALIYFADQGLLVLRLIYAHFIILSFWVWVQRLGLHTSYDNAPAFVLRIQKCYSPTHAPAPKAPKHKLFDPGASASDDFVKRALDAQEGDDNKPDSRI